MGEVNRETILTLCNEAIGKNVDEVIELCKKSKVMFRFIKVDGLSHMITSDCRFDRLNFTVNNRIITNCIVG